MLSISKSIVSLSKSFIPSFCALRCNFSSYESLKTDIKSNIQEPTQNGKTDFIMHLEHLIEARGPIPVADFMSMALMNPKYGFYQKKNVIGKDEAHFITSPEISPVFGELLGIWSYSQWTKLGEPKKVQLIELGPGKGTLMSDLLRAARHFPKFYKSIQLHMVEQSEEMIKKQQYSLNCVYPSGSKPSPNNKDKKTHMRINGSNSIDVFWHRTLDEVPEQYPTILVANEFLDALPIYKFQLSDKGWREVQIAINEDNNVESNQSSSEDTKDSTVPVFFKEVLNPNLSPITVAMLGGRLEGKNEEESGAALDEWLSKRKELLNSLANQLDNTLNSITINGKDNTKMIHPERKILFPEGVNNPYQSHEQSKIILPNDIQENHIFKGEQDEKNEILNETVHQSTINNSKNNKSKQYIDIISKDTSSSVNSTIKNNTMNNNNNTLNNTTKEPNDTNQLNNNQTNKITNTNTNTNYIQGISASSLSDAKLGDMIETCPEANMIIQNFAYRIEKLGGVGLFIDYGHNYASSNSLRGIRKHKFVNYLETPGEIDITADVDFYTLRKTVDNSELTKKKIECFGPIPQGYFLCGLGIEERVNQILDTITDKDDAEATMKAAERLVLKENMGEIFKCFAISSTGMPLGFEGGEQFL